MALSPTTLAGRIRPTRRTEAAEPARRVVWASSVLYTAVLFGGLYYDIVSTAAPGSLRLLGFVGCLVALFAVDMFERHRYPQRTPRAIAIALLATRLVLFVVIMAFDSAGLSRVLFVLVPFTAYFVFGRVVSIVLGIGCVGLAMAWFTITVPGWYLTAGYVSDLLMYGLGVILAISMAAVAVREQEARTRLEHTLRELERSHTQLTEYAGRVAELTTARERNRLAREIHDSLGHHLTAIAIQLEKASAFLDRERATAEQALADARWSAARALEDVRQSVRALREEATPFSLPEALADLVRHTDDARLTVTLDITGSDSGYDVTALTALYRAAQEALTNARRHAAATRVTLSVTFDGSHARLVVADNGRGLPDPDPDGLGFGLRGMRERMHLLGGDVDITSEPGAGTTVTVTVPRSPQTADTLAEAAR